MNFVIVRNILLLGGKKGRKKIHQKPYPAKFPVNILKNEMYRLQKKKCKPKVPTLGVLSKDHVLSVFPPSYIASHFTVFLFPYTAGE